MIQPESSPSLSSLAGALGFAPGFGQKTQLSRRVALALASVSLVAGEALAPRTVEAQSAPRDAADGPDADIVVTGFRAEEQGSATKTSLSDPRDAAVDFRDDARVDGRSPSSRPHLGARAHGRPHVGQRRRRRAIRGQRARGRRRFHAERPGSRRPSRRPHGRLRRREPGVRHGRVRAYRGREGPVVGALRPRLARRLHQHDPAQAAGRDVRDVRRRRPDLSTRIARSST